MCSILLFLSFGVCFVSENFLDIVVVLLLVPTDRVLCACFVCLLLVSLFSFVHVLWFSIVLSLFFVLDLVVV